MSSHTLDSSSPEMRERINDLIRGNSAANVPAARGGVPIAPTPIAIEKPEISTRETSATEASEASVMIAEVLGKNHKDNAAQAVRTAIIASGRVAIDQYGVARFLTVIGMKLTPYRLDGQEFRDFCQRIAVETTGKPLGKDAVTALVEVLRSQATHAGVRVQVHVRIAVLNRPEGSQIYVLDLMNEAGEIVLIGSNGWKVAHNQKIAFLGGGGALPLPVQPQCLEVAYRIVSEFLNRVGVPPDHVLILVALLCDWLRADTPHPVLNITGAAGGGKSSLARTIISLLDPTASGKLPETKIEEEHIAASAQSRHLLVADNASHLSRDAQDLICRCVYGYETSHRKYYSQTAVERLPINNPFIITSIIAAITAPDLHDRAIRLPFKPRRQFESQTLLAEVLDRERAEVLGALLSLLSAGMAHIATTRSSSHRLVDFALLGDGITTALGEASGHFSRLLADISRAVASDYAEGDELVMAILRVLKAQQKLAIAANALPALSSWSSGSCTIKLSDGTFRAAFRASALHEAIKRATPPNFNATYPRSPRALASALVLKLPILAALGLKTEKCVLKHAKQTVWAFEWR